MTAGSLVCAFEKFYVESEDGKTSKEYSIPRGVHINVQEGDHVKAGEALIDGPLNLHDLLAVLGEKFTQSYLVNAIQEVYRLQGVNINDKAHRDDFPSNDALGQSRRRR